MDFKELVQIRYSVRDYLPTDIDNDLLEKILDAARMAPSAVNFQPYKIYVFKRGPLQDRLKTAYHREWMKQAPIVLAIVGLHQIGWKRGYDQKDYTDVDTAILIDHLTLQAADLGLGTCWVCNFNTQVVRELLNLKPDEEPLALIPLGYPAKDDLPDKRRKSLNELVIYK